MTRAQAEAKIALDEQKKSKKTVATSERKIREASDRALAARNARQAAEEKADQAEAA